MTHTGLKPYCCAACKAQFTTKSNLERHVLRRHGVLDKEGQAKYIIKLSQSDLQRQLEEENEGKWLLLFSDLCRIIPSVDITAKFQPSSTITGETTFITDVVFPTLIIPYTMDLKMAQKGCGRDRSRDKICIQISKWPDPKILLSHFEICMRILSRDLSPPQPFWAILRSIA